MVAFHAARDPAALAQLGGQPLIRLRAARGGVVLADAQPVARRLAEAHAARDYRIEQLPREVPPYFLLHLPREVRARVEHGQHDAEDRQPRVHVPHHQLNRLPKLNQPFQRQVLRLQRDHHPVGGGQRVERQQAQRRRAVNQHHAVAVAELGQRPRQPVLTRHQRDKLHFGARELHRGRGQIEVLAPAGHGHLAERPSVHQGVVDGRPARVLVEPQAARRVGLRVHIDQQHALAGGGEIDPEVDGRGGLAHAAFLVRDCQHVGFPHSACPLWSSRPAAGFCSVYSNPSAGKRQAHSARRIPPAPRAQFLLSSAQAPVIVVGRRDTPARKRQQEEVCRTANTPSARCMA